MSRTQKGTPNKRRGRGPCPAQQPGRVRSADRIAARTPGPQSGPYRLGLDSGPELVIEPRQVHHGRRRRRSEPVRRQVRPCCAGHPSVDLRGTAAALRAGIHLGNSLRSGHGYGAEEDADQEDRACRPRVRRVPRRTALVSASPAPANKEGTDAQQHQRARLGDNGKGGHVALGVGAGQLEGELSAREALNVSGRHREGVASQRRSRLVAQIGADQLHPHIA
jgi:hypothetical protein